MGNDGTVVVAFSYDTEMAFNRELPEHVVSAQNYAILPLAEKQTLWADYIREGIWSDTNHRQRSIAELGMIRALGPHFEACGGAMTSFVLGQWLDYIVEELGQQEVRNFYNCSAIDVQSHSYNHLTFGGPQDAVRSRTSPNLALEEVSGQLRRANGAIERHLGVRPWGLRTPMGNTAPFGAGQEPILQALRENGIKFVSSWLKKAPRELNSPAMVQPFPYTSPGSPDLWEIPGVGKYDVHFMPPSKLLVFGEEGTDTPAVMLAHYIGVLEEALRAVARTEKTVYVPFVMHPWATVLYDPELKMHAELLRFCVRHGVLLRSYAQVYAMLAS